MASINNILGNLSVRPLSNNHGSNVNPAQAGRTHMAVLMGLDVSGSMGQGTNPDLPRLERAVANMIDQLRQPLANNPLGPNATTVDIAIFAYSNEIKLIQPWEQADKLQPLPRLTAYGGTHTGDALIGGLEYIGRRLRYYDTYQPLPIPKAVPHFFHFTDGAPTDVEIGDAKWNAVKALLQTISADKEKPFSMISHFIAQNGMDRDGHNTHLKDPMGNQLSGFETLNMWTGGENVYELVRAEGMFDTLMQVIVKSIGGASSKHTSIAEELKRFNVPEIRPPGSTGFLAPGSRKTGTAL